MAVVYDNETMLICSSKCLSMALTDLYEELRDSMVAMQKYGSKIRGVQREVIKDGDEFVAVAYISYTGTN